MNRVCAIYPLLPDPTDFLADVRRRFPDGEVELYTANAEAAKRAKTAGVEVYLHRSRSFGFHASEAVRKRGYDTIVMAAESSHFRDYLPFALQTLLWPKVKRFGLFDGNFEPFSNHFGLILKTILRYQLPSILMAVTTITFWLALLPFSILVGALKGRSNQEAKTLLENTIRFLATTQAYLTINPAVPLLPLEAVWRILVDYARGALPPEENRRLLLIRLDHLGDLIATTGVLEAIKRAEPPWHVTMVVGPWSRAVVEADERIDKLHVYPTADPTFRRGKLPADAAAERKRIRRLLSEQSFHTVIEPATSAEATALLYLPRAHRRATMQFDRWYVHGLAQVVLTNTDEKEADRLARIFAAAGIELRSEPTSLHLPPTAIAEAEMLLAENNLHGRKFLAVHLGAGWPGRCWPLERFIELVRRAHTEFGLVPVGLAGPGEEQIADAFLEQIRESDGTVFLKPQLPTIFAIIARAAAFVGNDSAFMHAAAAQGVPTLGIFGPTELARFYPTGKKVAAASLHLACSPCVQTYCTDQRCIKELSVELVWSAFRDLVKS